MKNKQQGDIKTIRNTPRRRQWPSTTHKICQGGLNWIKYASTTSDWCNIKLFEARPLKILLPHIKATIREGEEKIIVVQDNLDSHFSAKAVHFMQLLDAVVLTPMRKKWRVILDQCRKESRYPGSIPKVSTAA